MITAIKVNTSNDANGNPRRGWDVFGEQGYIGFVNSGYSGDTERVLRQKLNGTEVRVISEYNVTPAQYNALNNGPHVRVIKEIGEPVRLRLNGNGRPVRHNNRPTLGDAEGIWFSVAGWGWRIGAAVISEAWMGGMLHTTWDKEIVKAWEVDREKVKVGSGKAARTLDKADIADWVETALTEAIAWLNANVAPEGWLFQFDEGDFGLWSLAEDKECEGRKVEVMECPSPFCDDTCVH